MNKYKEGADILGVLGGGQLAKMIGFEAYRLGLGLAVIENGYDSPAGMMTKNDFGKGWNDLGELDKFIAKSTFITLENEFIDPDVISYIEQKKPVFPSSDTLRLVRDKYIQKETFRNKGIPTTEYARISNKEEAKEFGIKHGYPFVMKARELGYDGYGNRTVTDEKSVSEAFSYFEKKKPGIDLMAEAFVKFRKELAVMAVRSSSGEEKVYPCVETEQKQHICNIVTAPSVDNKEIRQKAQEMALSCVRSINGVGIFGVEFFLTEEGNLLVNEIAPRPHNSGHYTIEACHTSQFENCIRAVAGLPLGSTEMKMSSATMVNLLGDAEGNSVPNGIKSMMQLTDAKLHLYGKSESRVGRKMGHITVVSDNGNDSRQTCQEAANRISWK